MTRFFGKNANIFANTARPSERYPYFSQKIVAHLYKKMPLPKGVSETAAPKINKKGGNETCSVQR